MIVINIGSDNLIRVDELTNEATDEYVNDATVTMTLRDSDLEVVSGAQSLSLTYVAASNGRYHGALPDTLSLTAGSLYFLDVTTVSGSITRLDRIPCRAHYAIGD